MSLVNLLFYKKKILDEHQKMYETEILNQDEPSEAGDNVPIETGDYVSTETDDNVSNETNETDDDESMNEDEVNKTLR